MAYDGWVTFNGTELINLSRTAQLAELLGIDTLWTDSASVEWIASAHGGFDMLPYDIGPFGGVEYNLIEDAPWYDADFPASAEFAGVVPLSLSGLDDSSLEATTTEYITSGGSSGRGRNKTQPIVANVALIASTSQGADYGKRWLDRVLRAGGARAFCSGSELRYFRFKPEADAVEAPPQAHRRDVSLTRGTSVTRKHIGSCSATWLVTFTLTANDPFEYGDEIDQFTDLGGVVAGAGVATSGSVTLVEQTCPVYDYSPIYDPLHPALALAPSVPNFYPTGWALLTGVTFQRYWARTNPIEPSALNVVPVLTLTTDFDARYVRVSIWGSDSLPEDRCGPLWTAVVSYLPAGVDFSIDAEQEASYAWDGLSPSVRRTDSLVYGTGARPIQWTAFNDPGGLLVTLDVMNGVDYAGGGTVRAALALVPKSD